MFLLAGNQIQQPMLAVNFQAGRPSEGEQALWRRMAPSFITIYEQGQATGPAALIDRSGLFVAAKSAVLSDLLEARAFDGKTVHLRVAGLDSISQLVLLQASDWGENARPLALPTGSEQPGTAILAVLSTGPIRAEYVSGDQYGVVKPSRRLVPLNEFRFEAPAESVGTALVVTESGQLLGSVHATLSPAEGGLTPGNALTGTGIHVIPDLIKPKIGPAQLTVAYSVGTSILKRVLSGFLSPTHQVDYPTLGVVCSDAIGGGALVQQVVKASPAAHSGFRVGDVIEDIGGQPIADQVGFAKVMLDQAVGSKIAIRVKRGEATILIDVTIGKSE